MAGSTEFVFFDFTDLRLADRANILRAMNALSEGDRFRFLKKALVCTDIPGEKYVPNSAEMLDRAWTNALRAAPRYNGAYWMEFEGPGGAQFAFGYDPRKLKRLNITVSRGALTGPQGDATAAGLWDAVTILAGALQPAYGYGLFNYDTHELPPVNAGPQAAWDINVFGAALVEQFGRDALRTIPAARAFELPGGGILLALAANPVTGWHTARAGAQALAEVLGVGAVTLGG
ncbi:MAG: hypothetical protein JNL34_16580 [Anaerolineae bacterium]|nr:hypothetical protein [Anaerolineae bacterium]